MANKLKIHLQLIYQGVKTCVIQVVNSHDVKVRKYVEKTGFYYRTREDRGDDIFREALLNISGIEPFLQRCKKDGVSVFCENFSKNEIINKEEEIKKTKKWL